MRNYVEMKKGIAVNRASRSRMRLYLASLLLLLTQCPGMGHFQALAADKNSVERKTLEASKPTQEAPANLAAKSMAPTATDAGSKAAAAPQTGQPSSTSATLDKSKQAAEAGTSTNAPPVIIPSTEAYKYDELGEGSAKLTPMKKAEAEVAGSDKDSKEGQVQAVPEAGTNGHAKSEDPQKKWVQPFQKTRSSPSPKLYKNPTRSERGGLMPPLSPACYRRLIQKALTSRTDIGVLEALVSGATTSIPSLTISRSDLTMEAIRLGARPQTVGYLVMVQLSSREPSGGASGDKGDGGELGQEPRGKQKLEAHRQAKKKELLQASALARSLQRYEICTMLDGLISRLEEGTSSQDVVTKSGGEPGLSHEV